MISTIVLGLLSIFFAYLSRYRNTRWGLKISFILIFIFLALRRNFGNDYMTYFDAFNDIAQNNHFSFYNLLLLEPGWVLINWLFRDLGFYCMIAVLASLNCIIYYRFISRHIPVNYYWFAVFLYVFNIDIMLTHASAMRQSVAIMIFVFSLEYIYKKDLIRYILSIILASLFHFSGLLLFPIYLLAYFNNKINLLSGSLIFSIYILLIIGSDVLLPYVNLLISSFYVKYEEYQVGGKVNSGLGYIYYTLILILVLYNGRKQNKEYRLYNQIVIASILIMPMRLTLEMISRVGMYFIPATIIVFPNILMTVKNKIFKIIFFTLIAGFTFYQFFQFFYSETYHNSFMIYNTIFSTLKYN